MANYNLRWDAFQNNLCDGFAYLQQKSEFVDMTLAADGHFVQVHQSIIALASPFLKSLLKSLTCPHPVIYLDVSHEVLGFLLEYMYSGELILPQEKCKEFIKYGRKLKMFGLEKLPSYYDEPLVIEKLPEEANEVVDINLDKVTNIPQSTECAMEIQQNAVLIQEASVTTNDAIIIQPVLESQTLTTEPIVIPIVQDVPNIEMIPTNQEVATIPKKDIQVTNKLMQFLESVENYEFAETQRNDFEDTQTNVKITDDTNLPLAGFDLSPIINEPVITNVESTSYPSPITNVGKHQDMPNIHIDIPDTQSSDTFKVDTNVSNDFENLDFFKSPNDMTRLGIMNLESTSKEVHNMSIDENNETMNSIDTVLEYRLLGDFSIAGAKKQASVVDKGIKDDPWDLIRASSAKNLNNSDDESNTGKEDKIIDVEKELDKINRKNEKVDVSSLPNLDNETLFDESFRKDSELGMSDEEGGPMAPIKHSSPVPEINEHEHQFNVPELNPSEVEVSIFGQVIKKIEVPKNVKENPIIQYTLTNRDSLQLIVNRFVYFVHFKSGQKRRRWRCVDYRQKHCLAYVDTDGEMFIRRANAHNHGFHDARIARQIKMDKVFSTIDEAVTFCQKRIRRSSARNKDKGEEDEDDSD